MKKIRLFLVIALGLLFMASCTLNQTSITKEVNDEIKEGEASYVVTFVNEDGDELLSITKRATNKIIAKELAIEAKEGYNISFKNLDGEEIDLSMVRETMTVVVSYVAKEYHLKFYSGGALIDNQLIDAFSKATFPTEFKVPTGHEFIGWSLSRDEFIEAKEDEFLMPPAGTNLYAFFAKKAYKVTLLTDVQALNELENTKEYLFGERLGQYVPDALSEAIANLKDYTLLGWYLDEELTEPFKAVSMPAEDLVLYAKFEYPGVDFMVNGKVYHTAKGHPGDEVLFPQDPYIFGYTFEGWQDEESEDVTSLIFGDVARTLTAVFSANEGGYKVEYYCQNLGQSYILRETKDVYSFVGQEVEAEILDYVGFTYDEEASHATAAGVVLADNSLVLKVYYARCSYELKYLVDGELYGEVLTLKYQQLIIDPTAPSKDGYTFTGWDKEIPAQMPAADLTFNAQFSANKYPVKFMVDGNVYDEQLLDFDSIIEYPAAPEKLGYTFTSWDQTIEKVPAANVTINAQFAINSYEVAIIVEGETVYKETLEYNSAIEYPAAPLKEGYTFIGWNPNPAATPAADIVITAQFEINEYTVKFIVDDEVVKETKLEYNATIEYPSDPEKIGYTFTGWDQTLEKVPAADVTINAQFEVNSYQVVFVVDNEVYFDETKEFNQTIEYPSDPEKIGYTFTGWDQTLEKVPAADVTINAQFEINEYTVKFIVDGEVIADATLEYNATIVYPASPLKEGHTFTGWDQALEKVPAADVTFNAQFEINEYTVKFIVDGEVIADATLEYNAQIVYPADPEKLGYTFTGWDKDLTIVPAADVTFTAIFEENEVEIIDVLTRTVTGKTDTTYGDWTYGNYKGQSAGDNDSIQLRSKNSNSGIVSTKSIGKIKKIVITFNTATTTARKVDIYGSNTPYTAPTNLYNNSTTGTLIGSATYDGTNTTYTIIVTGDYEYIGIRSNDGALYLSQIEIYHSEPEPVQQYSISVTGLEHATMDTIPTAVDEGTNISFGITPDEGYEVSSVKANDEILTLTNNKYHFTVNANTVIEITIVEKEEEPEAETQTYTYTFTKSIYKGNGLQTLNGIKWTLNNNGGYYGYNATKGQQIGSGNNPATTLTLATSEISGTIKSIKIQTSGASGIACILSVTVGGAQFGDSISLTSTNTEYTFTGSAIGEISFNFAQTTSRAIYIKAIEIEYEA